MKQLVTKIKPASGFSHFIHIALTGLLPALLFILLRLGFIELAIAVIGISKWRMFAVKPRHWLANIRANAVDIIVGISIVIFMAHTGSQMLHLLWAFVYGVWLLVVKKQTSSLGVASQAVIGQFVGLTALFLHWGGSSSWLLVFVTWIICYSSARHFFTSYDEIYSRLLAYLWGYFSAALVWVLCRWLLFYGVIAQPTLLIVVISFGLGGMYYLEATDKLSKLLRRQLLFVIISIIIIVLTFSDWGDKTV